MARKRAQSGRASRGLGGISVDALQRELERRQAKAVELGRHRAKLASELDALDRKIAALGVKVGRARGMGARTRGQNSATLVDSLAALLKGNTMSVTQAAEEVQKAGYKTNSPNFRTIVNAALLAHKDVFKNVSRGKYTAK